MNYFIDIYYYALRNMQHPVADGNSNRIPLRIFLVQLPKLRNAVWTLDPLMNARIMNEIKKNFQNVTAMNYSLKTEK